MNLQITFDGCVKKTVSIQHALQLDKDHLATLSVDEKGVSQAEVVAYQPNSLDSLHAQLDCLEGANASSELRQNKLITLVWLCLGLNVLGAVYMVWRYGMKRQ